MQNKRYKSFKRGRRGGHVNHRSAKKRRYENYLARATCVACGKIFRSPQKKRTHVESGHKTDIGINPNRTTRRLSLFG